MCCHHTVVHVAVRTAASTAAVHADILHVAECLLDEASSDNAYHLE